MELFFVWSMSSFGASAGALLGTYFAKKKILTQATGNYRTASVLVALAGAFFLSTLFAWCATLILSPPIDIGTTFLVGLIALFVLTLTIVGPFLGVFGICVVGGRVGLEAAGMLDIGGGMLRFLVKVTLAGLLIVLLFGVSILPLFMF